MWAGVNGSAWFQTTPYSMDKPTLILTSIYMLVNELCLCMSIKPVRCLVHLAHKHITAMENINHSASNVCHCNNHQLLLKTDYWTTSRSDDDDAYLSPLMLYHMIVTLQHQLQVHSTLYIKVGFLLNKKPAEYLVHLAHKYITAVDNNKQSVSNICHCINHKLLQTVRKFSNH